MAASVQGEQRDSKTPGAAREGPHTGDDPADTATRHVPSAARRAAWVRAVLTRQGPQQWPGGQAVPRHHVLRTQVVAVGSPRPRRWLEANDEGDEKTPG